MQAKYKKERMKTMKALNNEELKSVTGGQDMEYWITVIQREYFTCGDSASLRAVYETPGNAFMGDSDISTAQKLKLKEIMDLLLTEKEREETA